MPGCDSPQGGVCVQLSKLSCRMDSAVLIGFEWAVRAVESFLKFVGVALRLQLGRVFVSAIKTGETSVAICCTCSFSSLAWYATNMGDRVGDYAMACTLVSMPPALVRWWICRTQSIHMFLRENSKRRQFERQRRMRAQTRRLQAEQHRSSSLLLNMLPASIVRQLTVRSSPIESQIVPYCVARFWLGAR